MVHRRAPVRLVGVEAVGVGLRLPAVHDLVHHLRVVHEQARGHHLQRGQLDVRELIHRQPVLERTVVQLQPPVRDFADAL